MKGLGADDTCQVLIPAMLLMVSVHRQHTLTNARSWRMDTSQAVRPLEADFFWISMVREDEGSGGGDTPDLQWTRKLLLSNFLWDIERRVVRKSSGGRVALSVLRQQSGWSSWQAVVSGPPVREAPWRWGRMLHRLATKLQTELRQDGIVITFLQLLLRTSSDYECRNTWVGECDSSCPRLWSVHASIQSLSVLFSQLEILCLSLSSRFSTLPVWIVSIVIAVPISILSLAMFPTV